jgi:two-component system, chemotaxis family, protein-glutamate methylesterase/glutaminase
MVIGNDHIHLTRGLKEGLQRPSINITFRSAADFYGDRTIGVLLSGMLDDGASGLWEIARKGGVAIIQDPHEAAFPSMPLSALKDAPVHFQLRSDDIVPILIRMVAGERVPEPVTNPDPDPDEPELLLSGFTCPECRGPLFQRNLTPSLVEFRCRVGHVFSPGVLLDEHSSTPERKLYEALVAIEEGASLSEFMADRSQGEKRQQFLKEVKQLKQYAAGIRAMIEDRIMPSPEPTIPKGKKN